ncbi:MAG: PEP-CTERM sorting domain-containing protein [Planctomycetes bacterium]|nr:PEP-CTERM sorting domain-containing protein [Planctomycetota bacterium]
MRGWLRVVLAVATVAGAVRGAEGLTIQFDYRYDTAGFFDPAAHPERRTALASAATWATTFTDDLAAIVPSGDNEWEAGFWRPDTGDWFDLPGLVVPADTLIIFAGARDLGGSLGLGGPGGYWVSGDQAWLDLVEARGQTSALPAVAPNFGPWGGSIAFHEDPEYPWYFGLDVDGLGSNESDFLSTATHELAHVLGFGTADSWDVFGGGDFFTGFAAAREHGGPVPLSPDGAHWAEGTMSVRYGLPQEAAMDPTVYVGDRKLMTDLDLAGLADVGWQVIIGATQWTGAAGPDWALPGSWADGVVPRADVGALFGDPAGSGPVLSSDVVVRGLDFLAAGWVISGPGYALAVEAGGIESVGPGENTIRPALVLAASLDCIVGAGNALVLAGGLELDGQVLIKAGPGRLDVTGPQGHAPDSQITVAEGTVALATDAGSSGARRLTVMVNGGMLEAGATQHLAAMDLMAGLAALTAPATRIVTDWLWIEAPGAALDVGSGALVVDYAPAEASPLPDVRGWLASGLNAAGGGYWDGDGIRSDLAAADTDGLTAVGVLDNTDPKVGGKTVFAGEAVDATAVLVRYTWWGDANLDGVVDANDYDVIDKNYLFPPAVMGWWVGDFNYDGAIDANDYDRIDKAYLFQGAPLAAPSPAPAPEPATLALLALGTAGAMLRRQVAVAHVKPL